MSKVSVKLPKNKTKVRIVRSDEFIRKDWESRIRKRQEELRRFEEQERKKKEEAERKKRLAEESRRMKMLEEQMRLEEEERQRNAKPVPLPQYYSQSYKIANIEKPVELSLEKVKERFKTREEHEAEIEKAYNRGFNEGQNLAADNFEPKIETLKVYVQRIDLVIDGLKEQYLREVKAFEDSVISLGMLTSEKILRREASVHSDVLIEQIRKSMEILDEDAVFIIRLNPSDIDIMKEVKSQVFIDESDAQKVNIKADSSVEKGFCILETSAGKIDSRLKTQIEKIETKLNEVKESPGYKSGSSLPSDLPGKSEIDTSEDDEQDNDIELIDDEHIILEPGKDYEILEQQGESEDIQQEGSNDDDS